MKAKYDTCRKQGKKMGAAMQSYAAGGPVKKAAGGSVKTQRGFAARGK